MKRNKCILCGVEFKGHGNNPGPLASPADSCCDICNVLKVIPERIKRIEEINTH